RARRAFERDDWNAALSAFDEADRAGGLLAPDLKRAARCRLNLGRPEESASFLERASAAQASASDRLRAAPVAGPLCPGHLEGRRLTVAKGWQQRAARLLENEGPGRELAQFEWITGRLALAAGDYEVALGHAGRALELARSIE